MTGAAGGAAGAAAAAAAASSSSLEEQPKQVQDDIQSDPDKGVKVNAAVIAQPFRDEIKRKVERWKEHGIEAPLLVGLLANKDSAAKKYAEWTGRACRADGIRYELRTLEDPIDVEAALVHANDDPAVAGVIVYYPIFGQEETFSGTSRDDYIRDTVSYQCDVEGLCHLYRQNLYRNIRYLDIPTSSTGMITTTTAGSSAGTNQQLQQQQQRRHKCLLPCTALSVVKILERCPNCYDKTKPLHRHMEGKTVTVINRSEIVGRPLAAMLANDGATVYSVDINSIYRLADGGRLYKCSAEVTPKYCVRKSSVVVTGVPTREYRLPAAWVQPGTTVVNVASYKNVDETELLRIPAVVYVPQVGKVTVAMLERNLIRLFEQFHVHRQYTTTPYGTGMMLLQQQQQQQQQQEQEQEHEKKKQDKQQQQQRATAAAALNLYTAVTVTILLVLQIVRSRK